MAETRTTEQIIRDAERGDWATDSQFARARAADRSRRATGPCPCECNRGQFCGGCGHAGCGRR